MEFLGVIILIVIIVLVVRAFMSANGMSFDNKEIRCDGCGGYCTVSRREYNKKEHEAGLVKYYCGRCRSSGLK